MNTSVTDSIYQNMLDMIMSGSWRAGEKIPTEEHLAAAYNASRTSVRQAISRLKALEILESRRGSGTVVKKANISTTLTDIISTVMLDVQDNLQIFEFHKGIQIECAKLACFRYTDEQMTQLEALMQMIHESASMGRIDEAIDYDLRSHRLICEMSGNLMFVRATEIIYQRLQKCFQMIGTSFDYNESMVFHERLIAALKDRNPLFAASVMEAHQWDTYQKYLKLSSAPRHSSE